MGCFQREPPLQPLGYQHILATTKFVAPVRRPIKSGHLRPRRSCRHRHAADFLLRLARNRHQRDRESTRRGAAGGRLLQPLARTTRRRENAEATRPHVPEWAHHDEASALCLSDRRQLRVVQHAASLPTAEIRDCFLRRAATTRQQPHPPTATRAPRLSTRPRPLPRLCRNGTTN